MDAREELHGILRTTMDNKDATTVADAYRAEVLREAHDAIRADLAKLVEAEPGSYGMAYQQGMDWAARLVDQLTAP